MYYNFMPDFLDHYAAYVVDGLKARGAPQGEIDAMSRDLAHFKALSANPLIMAAFTILEPLPVGIIMTLLSAAVLRRTKRHASGVRSVSSTA
jgi:hypothetical protein